MMKTEQSHLAKEIEQWEKEFRRKNGRDPTEEDKYVISMVIYRYEQKQKTHFCTFVQLWTHIYKYTQYLRDMVFFKEAIRLTC